MNYYQESPEKVLEELRTTESGHTNRKGRDAMNYYQESPEKVLEELRTTESGLSHQEAGDRLAKCGPNKLAEGKKVTLRSSALFNSCATP